MPKSQSTRLNITQNHPDFRLEPLSEQPALFKLEYLKKTLNLIQENPEDLQTCTIKCLVRGCYKKWENQRIYKSTSSYRAYFRTSHKYIDLKAILALDNNSESKASSSQLSQPTLPSLFNKHSGQREESFTINHFKRLLLSFIVNNNISF
ncbi:hypothetical protein L207DRAFT_521411 [Hyaloscypha variabilis F]|uniref:Uncharacterized protein n=1 Tax=Hyaloscypha variabilis (strain UAMH 11265 / GT02V1 / F) TaxID=1149755 RepID=A0A2J6QR61_HYAVF|nr:hypothetical protein L207DRAFT_521411 [Hyaloscypha variabilis F]